jgi:hypothetical protein
LPSGRFDSTLAVRDTRQVAGEADSSELEKHGVERAEAAEERAEKAEARAEKARQEAAEAKTEDAAEMHEREAKIHDSAAKLHEGAEEMQRQHAAEHAENSKRPDEGGKEEPQEL